MLQSLRRNRLVLLLARNRSSSLKIQRQTVFPLKTDEFGVLNGFYFDGTEIMISRTPKSWQFPVVNKT